MELSWETVWPQFPSWTVLASSQIDSPLAPLAACIGVYGVSAVVAAGSAACVELLRCGRGARVSCGAFGFAAALWGAVPGAAPHVGAGDRSVALIQPGLALPPAGGTGFYQQELLESLLAQTRALRAGVTWVVWPEGSVLEPLADRPEIRRALRELVEARGIRLVLGAVRREGSERRVSALLLRPGHPVRALYDKRRLVPLAEAWPDWLPLSLRARLGRLAPPRPPAPGARRAARLPFELALCWESAFSALQARPAAPALLNLVNDGWYDDTPAAAQALRMARWRAIERGTWLLRAASTGISAVVAPDGRVAASLGIGMRGALLAPLARHSPTTAFERAGYTPLCLALAFGLALRAPLAALRTHGCGR
jgi:apolipoprotein N-acyltransferase